MRVFGRPVLKQQPGMGSISGWARRGSVGVFRVITEPLEHIYLQSCIPPNGKCSFNPTIVSACGDTGIIFRGP